jgi:hypothetical protein
VSEPVASPPVLETAVAAALFAATFLVGPRVHLFLSLGGDRRTMLSFCAGMSTAYVFVHVMPELHGIRTAFVESASVPLRHEGMAIYFVAMVGFLLFYGLDHLRARSKAREAASGDGAPHLGPSFRLHVGGFAVYVGLVSFLLVQGIEGSQKSLSFYALAMTAHFLSVEHSLHHEHGRAYERVGRIVLAAAALAGWGVALLVRVPHAALAPATAFVSGGVIMNSSIMELPTDKDGRFLPFLAGGIVYGLVLIPLA